MTEKRNYMLDHFKGIAVIGVVLVHFQFPGTIGSVLCSIGVAGVILFFLISGYYAYHNDSQTACHKIIKRFKRNLFITVITVVIYFIFSVFYQLIMGTFGEWIDRFTDPMLYFRMLIMGDFEIIFADPLWFMPALLYSYLILYFIYKKNLQKAAYIIMPFLLLLRIGMETYTNSSGADWHLSGNFLVGALPVMLLGNFIAYKKREYTLKPVSLTAICCILSALLMFISVNVKVMGLDVSQPFKIWCALSVFILALKLPQKKGIAAIGIVGFRYSLYIYLFHYMTGLIINEILLTVNAPLWTIQWCLPVLVIIASFAVSVIIYNTIKSNQRC